MKLIELTDYLLPPSEEGAVFERFNFCLARGDVCWLDADITEKAHLFFKAMATLTPPLEGTYYFKGTRLDFSSPDTILLIKKQIGYITSHSTLISNRSLRENLTLMQSYFDNNLSARVDDDTFEMCRHFSIADKIDMRPEDLELVDVRSAIVIREFMKSPELLLLEKPEIYLGHAGFKLFEWLWSGLLDKGVPVVFTSDDKKLIDSVSTRALVLHNGRLHEKG